MKKIIKLKWQIPKEDLYKIHLNLMKKEQWKFSADTLPPKKKVSLSMTKHENNDKWVRLRTIRYPFINWKWFKKYFFCIIYISLYCDDKMKILVWFDYWLIISLFLVSNSINCYQLYSKAFIEAIIQSNAVKQKDDWSFIIWDIFSLSGWSFASFSPAEITVTHRYTDTHISFLAFI